MNEESIKRFAEMILGSHSAVFFGGAGVSTESGVKDYRSKDGLYQTVKQYGVSPETILSHSFFFAHPEIFYDFYSRYFLSSQVQPNRAHRVLAELERRGRLRGVITQNIDGLHQAAGSRNVIELHGTAASHHCSACGKEYPTEKLKEQNAQLRDKISAAERSSSPMSCCTRSRWTAMPATRRLISFPTPTC